MKKLILMIAFGFISTAAFSQAPLEEGGVQLNGGVGVSDWGGVPVYFGVDYGIARDWTIGGQLSFQTDDDPYHYGEYTSHYKSNAIGIGGNGNYHFNRILNMPSKFDFYAGANLTYFIWNYDDYDGNHHPDHDAVGLGLQVGGRYFFTDNFGINLEFGGNTGTTNGAKFGVTFKL
jgi:outer membrane immunogenic protein